VARKIISAQLLLAALAGNESELVAASFVVNQIELFFAAVSHVQ